MKTKETLLGLAFFLTAGSLSAAVTISGTSLNNATGLSDGQVGVYVISNDGTAFSSVTSLLSGVSITDSSTYGSSFTVLGSNTAATGFGATTLSSGHSINLSGGVDNGDSFGVFVFESSTGNTLAGDTFSVWSDASWVLPSDGAQSDFTNQLAQLSGSPISTGTVVPEPSSFALLAGVFGLAWVMVRRRA